MRGVLEEGFQVAGAVEDSGDFDAVGGLAVEDEVLSDGEAAEAGGEGVAGGAHEGLGGVQVEF